MDNFSVYENAVIKENIVLRTQKNEISLIGNDFVLPLFVCNTLAGMTDLNTHLSLANPRTRAQYIAHVYYVMYVHLCTSASVSDRVINIWGRSNLSTTRSMGIKIKTKPIYVFDEVG